MKGGKQLNEANIKSKAFSSVIWKFLERFVAQGVSLIVSIILARMLTPEDYSTVGIVTIFFTFSNILISGGLNTALIQKKEADEKDYSTVLNISIILSVILYIVLFLTAPFIADLYNQPILILIIRIMGLTLPINAVKSIWCAYISSNLDFRKFFFSTFGGVIISAIVGIIMALKGFGAWALVAQQMVNVISGTIILCITTRISIKPKIYFERFKSLFGYGWKMLVSSAIGTFYSEINPVIIGLKYSPVDLSFYTKGRSFPTLISTATTNTLSAVLFPVLSKYQDSKEKLLNHTRLFMKLSSFVSFPLLIGFLAVSDNFIHVLLTDKWLPASPYIKIFCISAMFDVINIGNCETIKAMGRSDIYLIMEIIKKTGYFITIGVFLLFSNTPEMLAISYNVCTIIAIIVNSIPNQKLIGYKYKNQLMDLIPNLISAIIMGICVTFVGMLHINKIILLVLQVFIGGIVYLFINIIIKNNNLSYLLNMIRNIINVK